MQHLPVGAAPQQPAGESGIYFACVPPDVPLGDLVQLFSMCGRIVDINLYKAYAKARVSKGCGIVVFATPAEAQNAIRHLRGASIWPHAREPLLLEPRLPDSHKPPKGARTHWMVQVPMLQLGQPQSLHLQVPGNATALAALQAQSAQSGVAPGIPGLLPALGPMGQQAAAGTPQAHPLHQQQQHHQHHQQQQHHHHQHQQVMLWQQQQQQQHGGSNPSVQSFGFAPAGLQGSSQLRPHLLSHAGLSSETLAVQAVPYGYTQPGPGMQQAAMGAAGGVHQPQAFHGEPAAAQLQHQLQQQQQQHQQQQYVHGQGMQQGSSEQLHSSQLLVQQGLQQLQQQAAIGGAALHTQRPSGSLPADWVAAHMLTAGGSQPQAGMPGTPGQQQQQQQEGVLPHVFLREDNGGTRSLTRDDSGNSRLFLREGSGSGRVLLREGSGVSVHSDPGPGMPIMPVERTGSGMSTLPCLMEDHPMQGNAMDLASPPDLSRGCLSSFTSSFSLPSGRTDSDSSTSSRFHMQAPTDMDLQRAVPSHGTLSTPRPLHLRDPPGPSPLSPPAARSFASAAHAAAVAAAGGGGGTPLLTPLVNMGVSTAADAGARQPDAAAAAASQASQAAGAKQLRALPLAPHQAPLLAEHLRSLSRLAGVELQLQEGAGGQPSLHFEATNDQVDLLQLLISRLL